MQQSDLQLTILVLLYTAVLFPFLSFCRCSLNLWEMAAFLKTLGVVNAINLDGGGSATLVLNGTLANYPSDHW